MFKLITKEEIDKNAGTNSGIYRIFWIKKGKQQPISRIGGIDKTGLLYVGHTTGQLKKRLNHFRCSAFLRSTNHSGGKKYRTNVRLRELIKPDEIYAEVAEDKNSHDFETIELKHYKEIYGEVPPLNG